MLAALIICGFAALSAFADINLPLIPIDDIQNEGEDVWTYTVTGADSVTVTGYTGTRTFVSIPAKLSQKNVTAIGDSAFYNKSSITNISIPSSVSAIGDSAFENCAKLKDVFIPSGVESLGESAFKGCRALKSVSLPAGLTSIGANAFSGCSALESVVIPSEIAVIEQYTFYGCSSLASVAIPASVTSIDQYAFSGCSALETVEFGGSRVEWNDISIHETNQPLFSATLNCAVESLPDRAPGDLDGDGAINAADVIALMRHIIGLVDDGSAAEYADYNGDGFVNNRDVLLMMLDIANGIV